MKARYSFFYLFLFLLCSGSSVMAQNFIVKGVVFEKGSNVRVALANITNTRTRSGVTSNDIGMFQIPAAIGDTLLITKTNLNDQRIEILGHQDILIYLVRGSTTLNEVTIVGNSKKQDLAEIKREDENKG